MKPGRFVIVAPGKGKTVETVYPSREFAKQILIQRRALGRSFPGERVVTEATYQLAVTSAKTKS